MNMNDVFLVDIPAEVCEGWAVTFDIHFGRRRSISAFERHNFLRSLAACGLKNIFDT